MVGPLDRDPEFVARLSRRISAAGLADRITLAGPAGAADLRARYAAADLLVLPARLEAYGMVVTEALAVGLPVLGSSVGGVPEALGPTAQGVPGLLVSPGDAAALRNALADWLDDRTARDRLRQAALARRASLPTWEAATQVVAGVLDRVRTEPEQALPRVLR